MRILLLLHDYLVPPEDVSDVNLATVIWKTEYDVLSTLLDMGHEVYPLGVSNDLEVIKKAVVEWKPKIAFNLLEGFDEIGSFDQNLVAYLELLRLPYTGCNPRGLLLARDKALSKKLMAYHRIPLPGFVVFRRGRSMHIPRDFTFPMIVKSLTQDASIGISQASVVKSAEKLLERVTFIHRSIGTDAIAENYIAGRELYVGVLGNERLKVFPVWELAFRKMPKNVNRIATDRVKWSVKYQKKHGVMTDAAKNLPRGMGLKLQRLAKRVYQVLELSGYARIDFRLDEFGRVAVLEANPNPQIAYGEDFAESAEYAGLSYEELLRRLLSLGLRWKSDKSG
jgi:D-alanine-D-alanine ligase